MFSKRRSEIGHRLRFIGLNVAELNHPSSQIAVSALQEMGSYSGEFLLSDIGEDLACFSLNAAQVREAVARMWCDRGVRTGTIRCLDGLDAHWTHKKMSFQKTYSL
jgi:hypothetical protein